MMRTSPSRSVKKRRWQSPGGWARDVGELTLTAITSVPTKLNGFPAAASDGASNTEAAVVIRTARPGEFLPKSSGSFLPTRVAGTCKGHRILPKTSLAIHLRVVERPRADQDVP